MDKQSVDYYSKKNVRRGLLHYLWGTSFVSIVAFIVAIIVIRELEVVEYAYYTALTGLLLLLMLLSNLGLERAIPKFISESLQKSETKNVVFLVIFLFVIRLVSLTLILVLMYLSSNSIFLFFKIQLSEELTLVFLAYVFFFGISMHLQRTLQAILLQKIVAIGLSLDWFVRLSSLLMILYFNSQILLIDVFLAQLFGLILGVIYLGINLFLYVYKCNRSTSKQHKSYQPRLNRVFQFSVYNYFQSLSGVHLLPSSGRLFAASLLSSTSVAFVGFAYALTGAFKRYLPATLFLGLIEPVIMGRYGKSQNFQEVVVLTGMLLKLNIFIIFPVIVWLLVVGEGLINWISNDKYGEATWVVAILLFILALESHRSILQLICNAVDRSELLLFSNLVTLIFLPALIFLMFYYDILGMMMGLVIIYWIRNFYVERMLRKSGFYFDKDWSAFIKIVFISVVSTYMSTFLLNLFSIVGLMKVFLSLVLAVIFYLCLSYLLKPFTHVEREKINGIIGRRLFFW